MPSAPSPAPASTSPSAPACSAEVVTIGTEILLGEIVDTNAAHIARSLRNCGINVYRKTSVGDNVERIAAIVREASERANVVITTGGLGPTVDDPTRDAIARAVGVDTEFRPELWEQVRATFRRFAAEPPENNRRQAYIPRGAIPVPNPVGTAPCFIVPTARGAIIALPGVPREMEHILAEAAVPWLRERFDLRGAIAVRVLRTAGVGESVIDARIGDLETLGNPTVGLAAHGGQVDVRITARAESTAAARDLIGPVEAELRGRLGEWIFGVDGDTLADAALRHIASRGWTLAVVEAGLGGRLAGALAGAAVPGVFAGGEVRSGSADTGEGAADWLAEWLDAYRRAIGADIGLGIALDAGDDRSTARLCRIGPGGTERRERPHGGHPRLAAGRAVNLGLDWLREV